jgi:hypothetical protein
MGAWADKEFKADTQTETLETRDTRDLLSVR